VPRNLSSALRGAEDPEKISEIALTVEEKIEFEKKIFGAPWRPNRKGARSCDHIYGKLSLGTRIPENTKSVGLDLTTLFDFFDIALGLTDGMSGKFCYIRTCDVQKHYYGVVLYKLFYTRRDRSRGIRDEATAFEPEVVSRERTWPPQPVSQPSRATGRPFGTKYDNIN